MPDKRAAIVLSVLRSPKKIEHFPVEFDVEGLTVSKFFPVKLAINQIVTGFLVLFHTKNRQAQYSRINRTSPKKTRADSRLYIENANSKKPMGNTR